MKKRWICLFVENEIGVLARIAGLFSAKSYNLDKTFEQIKKQINRSVEVIKLVDYTDRPIHMREILFVRVNGCSDSDITELFRISNVFDVPIIDYDSTTVLLECIQTENWNKDLISLLSRKFSNRIEIVRGGSVAVEAVSISER